MALLRQIVAQLPNANCPICFPHCQEVSVLAVEGQTSCSLVRTSLLDGGCWPEGPVAQVEYLHITLEMHSAESQQGLNLMYKSSLKSQLFIYTVPCPVAAAKTSGLVGDHCT